MKFFNTYFIAFMLLCIATAGCQDDDNYFVKQEAFSVVTVGFNGSDNELEMTIDTMTIKEPISAGTNFSRTDKYTFPDGKDSVKVLINEKTTGNLVYERSVKRGDYAVKIELIYVGGKLIEKPVAPVDNPAGFRLVSYLFLPRISGYQGDVDIVYFKKTENIVNGQWNLVKLEELTRITAKPYQFSAFLRAPAFQGGRNEIDGQVYYLNPRVEFFKAGTNIPYYEEAGFTLRPGTTFPLPFNAKPQIVGIMELGAPGGSVIDNFQQVQF